MFVVNGPDLSLEVLRLSDRCICGASALVTSGQGIDKGYCKECAKKRKEFADEIIGNIYI